MERLGDVGALYGGHRRHAGGAPGRCSCNFAATAPVSDRGTDFEMAQVLRRVIRLLNASNTTLRLADRCIDRSGGDDGRRFVRSDSADRKIAQN
jgi:hypothetical protein